MENQFDYWDYSIGGRLWRIAAEGNAVVMTMPIEAAKALDRVLERFNGRIMIEQRTEVTDLMARQLEEFMAGNRKRFDVEIKFHGTEFERKVWEQLTKIGYGQLITYGELGRKCGLPAGARAVGGAVGRNPLLVVVPCHRVLAANGHLGGFAAGLPLKKTLLKLELNDNADYRGKSNGGVPEFPF